MTIRPSPAANLSADEIQEARQFARMLPQACGMAADWLLDMCAGNLIDAMAMGETLRTALVTTHPLWWGAFDRLMDRFETRARENRRLFNAMCDAEERRPGERL